MSIRKKLPAIALSAMALAGVGVAAGPGEAFAGTNGQHVEIVNWAHGNMKGAWIRGKNLNEPGHQQWIGVNAPDPFSGNTQTGVSNWWWNGGSVDIDWVDSNNHFAGTTHCTVPVNQGSNNWVTCNRF